MLLELLAISTYILAKWGLRQKTRTHIKKNSFNSGKLIQYRSVEALSFVFLFAFILFRLLHYPTTHLYILMFVLILVIAWGALSKLRGIQLLWNNQLKINYWVSFKQEYYFIENITWTQIYLRNDKQLIIKDLDKFYAKTPLIPNQNENQVTVEFNVNDNVNNYLKNLCDYKQKHSVYTINKILAKQHDKKSTQLILRIDKNWKLLEELKSLSV